MKSACDDRAPSGEGPPGAFALPPGAFALPPGAFALPPGAFALPPGAFALGLQEKFNPTKFGEIKGKLYVELNVSVTALAGGARCARCGALRLRGVCA